MTRANTAPSDAGFFGTEQRILPRWSGLGRAWTDYRTYLTTLHALKALTDKQLGDIGLRRDALRSIASQGGLRQLNISRRGIGPERTT